MSETADDQSKPVIDSAEALAHALGDARWTGHGWTAQVGGRSMSLSSIAMVPAPTGSAAAKAAQQRRSLRRVVRYASGGHGAFKCQISKLAACSPEATERLNAGLQIFLHVKLKSR
jgi:hypothetical protein